MPGNSHIAGTPARYAAINRRSVVGGLLTFSASLGSAAWQIEANAAMFGHRLMMIEDDGCVYCVRWHAEVGQAYANSREGQFAPLDRRRIRDPNIAFLRNVRYTPTFVLLDGDTEIGRITGYPGVDFFWQLLADLLAKTDFNSGMAPAPPDDIKT